MCSREYCVTGTSASLSTLFDRGIARPEQKFVNADVFVCPQRASYPFGIRGRPRRAITSAYSGMNE